MNVTGFTVRQLIESFVQLGVRGYSIWLKVGHQANDVDVAESLRIRRRYRCRVKQCYANCQRIVTLSTKFAYYEGMAISGATGIPVSHAWLLDLDTGRIIDPTWVREKDPLTGLDYFGVHIPTAFVQSCITKYEAHVETICYYIPTLMENQNERREEKR